MKFRSLLPLFAIIIFGLTSITACSNTSSSQSPRRTNAAASSDTPSSTSTPTDSIESQKDRLFEQKLSRFSTYLRWSTNVSSEELIALGKIACDNWNSSNDSYPILSIVNERVGNASVASAIILAGAEVYCPAKYTAIMRSILAVSY